MADDTAALVLSLEARFDKFEKAMNDAAKVVDNATKKIEGSFAEMTKVVSDKLTGIQQSLVGRLGLAGELMSKLGPGGIAAAAGIGLMALAFKEAADAALAFGEKMKQLRDLSMVTGLTTTELQALKKVTADIGVDIDAVTPAIEKYIRNWELLRRGSGELRTELLRINPALEAQLATAKDSAEAIRILSKAFEGLSAAQAQALGRAAFGRGATDALRVFIKGVDLDAAIQKQRELGKALDPETVNKTAEAYDKLMVTIKGIQNASQTAGGLLLSKGLEKATELLGKYKDLVDSVTISIRNWGKTQEEIPANVTRLTVTPAPAPREVPIEERAKQQRELVAFLGAAATQSEKYKDATLQLDAAVKENGRLAQYQARAVAEVDRAFQQATLAAKERFGIASQQEIQTSKNIDLERAQAQGLITGAEKSRAALIAAKEAKEQFDAQMVRTSNFPGLTRMAIDLNDINKQLDQFGTQSINTFVDSMADAVTGAKSLKDAFTDMANSILKDIARIAIRQAIVKPLLSSIGIPGLMAGGPAMAGTPYIVGERGPELFVPNTSGTVVPNNRLGNLSIGAPTTNVTVQGSADRSTITLMQQMLAQRDKRFVADVARATTELRRRSVSV